MEYLKIHIPWASPFSGQTNIEVRGLYMLMVPTTSIKYNKEKEEAAEHEAKMNKIVQIELAKQRDKSEAGEKEEEGDSFTERLLANMIKHLKVEVTDIHIRYEDKDTNSESFGAGVTLDKLEIWTNDERKSKDDSKQRAFNKVVKISSLGVYWQPKERVLYSEVSYQDDHVKDKQFKSKIAR